MCITLRVYSHEAFEIFGKFIFSTDNWLYSSDENTFVKKEKKEKKPIYTREQKNLYNNPHYCKIV